MPRYIPTESMYDHDIKPRIYHVYGNWWEFIETETKDVYHFGKPDPLYFIYFLGSETGSCYHQENQLDFIKFNRSKDQILSVLCTGIGILINILYSLALQNYAVTKINTRKFKSLRKYVVLILPLYVTNCQDSFFDTTLVVSVHLYCVTAVLLLTKLWIFFIKNTIQYISDGCLRRLFEKTKVSETCEGPNVTFNKGAIDLWNAAKNGDIKTMKKLLDNTHVSQFLHCKVGSHDTTPVEAAIRGGSYTAVTYLYQNIDMTIYHDKQDMIFMAIESRHPRILSYLLDNISGMKELINQKRNGITPLVCSTYVNSLNCFKVLIKRGADLTIPDNVPFTVLQIAASNGSWDILQYIYSLSSTIDLSSMYRKESSPFDTLHLAIDNIHWECAKEVIKQDSISVLDENGDSVLHIIYNHEPLVHMDKILLNRGFNVNRLDDEDQTPFSSYIYNFGINESLLQITRKLCLHIEAGLQVNHITSDDIGDILSAYEQYIYDRDMEDIVYILHQCGFKFEKCKEQFQPYENLHTLIIALESAPLSLQRLCGNTIRYSLQPNAITGIIKLNLPKQIKEIIML